MNVQNPSSMPHGIGSPPAAPSSPATCPGFGNGFETEALPGALPVGRNSPQRCPYGLYAEQLSRLALHGAAHHQRALLALPHPPDGDALGRVPAGRCRPVAHRARRTRSSCRSRRCAGTRSPIPAEPLSFVEGMRTITTAGDAGAQAGMGAHRLPRHPLDGGRVLLQRRRRDAVRAAAGRPAALDRVRHHRHRARRDRRHPARREDPRRAARTARPAAISARITAARFTLPERGPIGANCLANPARLPDARSRPTRTARRPRRMYVKWGGELWVADIDHSPLDVVAWHGNYAPYKYDLRQLLAGRPDPVRPCRPVDLHRADLAVRDARHGQYRLRDLLRTAGWWRRTPSARPGTT